jgi:hypothetical protein
MTDLIYGAEGDRTPDLMNAIHALSQLSYGPVFQQRGVEKSSTQVPNHALK